MCRPILYPKAFLLNAAPSEAVLAPASFRALSGLLKPVVLVLVAGMVLREH